jgi:DMSO/TMAO reductase YedYZ molybdopterin-dependent catalytic subunit
MAAWVGSGMRTGTSMGTPTAPIASGALPRRSRWTVGAALGLLTAGVALAAAQLAAAFVGEIASPLVAVGEAAIDATPPWLRDFAIREFGSKDKLVLLIGIGVVLGLFAVVMGVLALRRKWVAFAGLAGFGVIGVLAAVSRPTADELSALPSVVGVGAGWAALRVLLPRTGAGHREARRLAPPRKPVTESPLAFDRRRFIAAGLAVGGAAALAGIGSRFVGRAAAKAQASRASLRIPRPFSIGASGTDLRIPGLSSFYTPNTTFYRVDTALIVPKVPAEDWHLRIHGMVDREIELDFATLVARPLIERDITLTCVSNEVGGKLAGNARWIGPPLKPLLDEAGVRSGASQLVSRSADGFTIGTPTAVVMDGRDAMLAVAMNGEPLPLAHGFPVRMVVPGLYGYVSATKWVVDMELTTFEAYDAYWIQRGWAQQAPIKTMSRIDVPRNGYVVPAGPITVAGVAWAQHRGIERVEIRVDDGPWQPADLAPEETVDTWRQWRFDWEARPPRHTLQVRATDRTGSTQTGMPSDPPPDGATGWHTIVVKVE